MADILLIHEDALTLAVTRLSSASTDIDRQAQLLRQIPVPDGTERIMANVPELYRRLADDAQRLDRLSIHLKSALAMILQAEQGLAKQAQTASGGDISSTDAADAAAAFINEWIERFINLWNNLPWIVKQILYTLFPYFSPLTQMRIGEADTGTFSLFTDPDGANVSNGPLSVGIKSIYAQGWYNDEITWSKQTVTIAGKQVELLLPLINQRIGIEGNTASGSMTYQHDGGSLTVTSSMPSAYATAGVVCGFENGQFVFHLRIGAEASVADVGGVVEGKYHEGGVSWGPGVGAGGQIDYADGKLTVDVSLPFGDLTVHYGINVDAVKNTYAETADAIMDGRAWDAVKGFIGIIKSSMPFDFT